MLTETSTFQRFNFLILVVLYLISGLLTLKNSDSMNCQCIAVNACQRCSVVIMLELG